MPITYRIRLGRRFDPPEKAGAFTEALERYFIDELRDTYDAERQLTKALPRLAKAAAGTQLREAFETHLAETEGHVAKVLRLTNATLSSE